MKLLRYGPCGQEKPALLDAQGQLRDLSPLVSDIDAHLLAPQGLRALAGLDPAALPLVSGAPRLGAPLANVGKFIGVGLNYSDHAAETGKPIPTEPVLFHKAISSINGPNDDVLLPPGAHHTDWEVELGVVIGVKAQTVSESDALAHVAAYCVVNDLSEKSGTQWSNGKGHDTYGPIGPYLVTADEIPDPQALDLWLDVNGKRCQSGNTSTMIFRVAYLISHLSRLMTLMPGDVITTGTPPGTGAGLRPPRFLKDGDVMTLGIQGLGEQRQRVRSL